MDSRREFLKKAALLSGGSAFLNMLPPVIQKALAIDPAAGSTFYDAEHIVFLMQENRSFDHIFGSLQGVRGFNDPRAICLPNGYPVWFQTDKKGDTYAPFRLNTKDSKAAWMGSLPHGWSDQTDARNDGKYDRWLEVKQARRKDYMDMPLTLGYCTREDFPFYYSLADAFTVCDHNFCSSLTGTHSNRYYWMTGSIRDDPADYTSKAHVWNITDYRNPELAWKTFPERLEENGISWRVYQNDLSMGFGLTGDEWLSNFGTNVLEYFRQYNVRLEPGRIDQLSVKRDILQQMVSKLEKNAAVDGITMRKLAAAKKLLAVTEADLSLYTPGIYESLSPLEKALNSHAFTTNAGDPHYHDLSALEYGEGGVSRSVKIPRGDILYQFRQDVENGRLPTVSWLSAPANFSDHPSVPWFGPWYVSEVMEILLKNPDVWRKTIVIINYDENDGYFDHLPPFVVPSPYKEGSGKVSAGIDTRIEFATASQQVNPSASQAYLREAPLGLGYRVPMIVASPWSRGGFVCSQVFDHTSSLQFLEKFLSRKTGKRIEEPNITAWRRAICGDLTSVFRQQENDAVTHPQFINRKKFIEAVNEAQYKSLPGGFQKFTSAQKEHMLSYPIDIPSFPQQERGVKSACALPYELYLDGVYDKTSRVYSLLFQAGDNLFGKNAAGAPFYVYAIAPYGAGELQCRNYAVTAGDKITDTWELAGFENGRYHLKAYGPNGFYREFRGDNSRPELIIITRQRGTRLIMSVKNTGNALCTVIVQDNGYKTAGQRIVLAKGDGKELVFDVSGSHGWYDLSVRAGANEQFEERFAGKIETGEAGKTDPLMGRVV